MKKTIAIALFIAALSINVLSQIVIEPAEFEQEIMKVEEFYKKDAGRHPYTIDEIQEFCNYIEKNSVVKDLKHNDKLAIRKIKVAKHFYEHIKDKNHKAKVLDLMINMFTDIQTERDRLGVDPLSSEESWLYEPPSPPAMSEKERENANKGMTSSNPRSQEAFAKITQLHHKISILEHVHAYLHRAITEQMKIPLEGISLALERSPAEKERTKEMLERQAAASGRKKPEQKIPAADHR